MLQRGRDRRQRDRSRSGSKDRDDDHHENKVDTSSGGKKWEREGADSRLQTHARERSRDR